MTPCLILLEARRQGVEITLAPDASNLLVRHLDLANPEHMALREQIVANKPELVRILNLPAHERLEETLLEKAFESLWRRETNGGALDHEYHADLSRTLARLGGYMRGQEARQRERSAA